MVLELRILQEVTGRPTTSRLIGPGSRFPGIARRASIDRFQFLVDLDEEFERVFDASLVHDVVPADALRGLGRSSALIMRTGLPALGQDRAFLHRKVRTQRTLTQASDS